MKCSVETSARHVHLPEDVYKQLFGADAEMKAKKELSGGGGFVDERRVTLVGPKGTFERVAILGPYRPFQVELAKTDARKLGVDAPIRISGDTAGSAPIKVVGDAGEYEAAEGAIVAKRHIHIGEEYANEIGVKKNDIVQVKLTSDDRSLIFDDVVIRINNCTPLMHIDTDECNAAGLPGTVEGEIIVK